MAETALHAALDALSKRILMARDVEVSLVLADDITVQALNRDYRGQDKPTNVLSFAALEDGGPALPGEPVALGDVVLALETVLREAREQGKPLADHLRHLTVHGALHLLGFDHESDEEATEMEALEVSILAGLGIADPYSGHSGQGEPADPGPAGAVRQGGAA